MRLFIYILTKNEFVQTTMIDIVEKLYDTNKVFNFDFL